MNWTEANRKTYLLSDVIAAKVGLPEATAVPEKRPPELYELRIWNNNRNRQQQCKFLHSTVHRNQLIEKHIQDQMQEVPVEDEEALQLMEQRQKEDKEKKDKEKEDQSKKKVKRMNALTHRASKKVKDAVAKPKSDNKKGGKTQKKATKSRSKPPSQQPVLDHGKDKAPSRSASRKR